jgi:hypothetical protein
MYGWGVMKCAQNRWRLFTEQAEGKANLPAFKLMKITVSLRAIKIRAAEDLISTMDRRAVSFLEILLEILRKSRATQ